MGEIELVPDGPDAWLLRVDGVDHSHVDLADPTRLEFDYVRRIADVLDLAFPPGQRIRVVHVGGAGLTLPRYVAATRPTSAQIVLEPDEDLTAYVRDRLPLPPRSGIKVRPVDGRRGLAALRPASADAVVLDAYDGPVVPAELTTLEAFAQLATVLDDDGVLVANLGDRSPFAYTRRALAGCRASLPEVLVCAEPATLRGRRFGNVVVVAGRRPWDPDALVRRAASSPLPYRVLAAGAAADRFGGGRPFTDADAETSPRPPDGRATFS